MSGSALSRARALIDLDRDAEARTLLGTVLAEDPGDPQALCLLAQACLGLRDNPAALDTAARAAREAPYDEWPRRLMSLALARLGRLPEARQQADAAISLDPDEWRTHLNRAQVDVVGEQVTHISLTAAQGAVRMAPLEPEAHRVLGTVQLSMGAHSRAEASLREALRLDPQNYPARNDLARLDLSRRRFGDAARGFADAAAMDPTDSVAADNLLVVGAKLLRRLHLVLWFVVFLAGRYALDAHHYQRQVLGLGLVVALVVLAVFAKDLQLRDRRTLALGRTVLARDRLLAVWAASLVVALVAITVGVFAPLAVLPSALGVAVGCLFIGVLVTWGRARVIRRRTARLRAR